MLQHLHSGLRINSQYTSDGRSCFFERRLLDLDNPKKYSKYLITWQYLWYWLFSTYWDQAFISTTFSSLPDGTLFVLEQYACCPYWWKCAAWPVKPIWWKWWQLSAWGGTRCGFGRQKIRSFSKVSKTWWDLVGGKGGKNFCWVVFNGFDLYVPFPLKLFPRIPANNWRPISHLKHK